MSDLSDLALALCQLVVPSLLLNTFTFMFSLKHAVMLGSHFYYFINVHGVICVCTDAPHKEWSTYDIHIYVCVLCCVCLCVCVVTY